MGGAGLCWKHKALLKGIETLWHCSKMEVVVWHVVLCLLFIDINYRLLLIILYMYALY